MRSTNLLVNSPSELSKRVNDPPEASPAAVPPAPPAAFAPPAPAAEPPPLCPLVRSPASRLGLPDDVVADGRVLLLPPLAPCIVVVLAVADDDFLLCREEPTATVDAAAGFGGDDGGTESRFFFPAGHVKFSRAVEGRGIGVGGRGASLGLEIGNESGFPV